MVEFNNEKIPLYKLIIHCVQLLFSLTIWCLEIVVFKNGEVNGRMGWTFGVCFLSVPGWIYLVMAPRWPRTRKLANANAMLCVDALYTIIWLSAFSTQAAYNTAGDCNSVCNVSKAIVALGVFETIFWGISTFISVATLQYYNFNGVLPGYENLRGRTTVNNIDPDKAAFSTAPVDEEGHYAPVGMNDDEPEFNASPYGGAGSHGHGHGGASTMPHDPYDYNNADTSYGGGGGGGGAGGVGGGAMGGGSMGSRYGDHHPGAGGEYASHTPGPTLYSPPAAHDVHDDASSVHFPSANYDRIGLRQV